MVERTDSLELSSDLHTFDAPTLKVIKTEIKRLKTLSQDELSFIFLLSLRHLLLFLPAGFSVFSLPLAPFSFATP